MLGETIEQADERFMRMAIDEANDAFRRGEVPVGAVIVINGQIIAKAHNLTETLHDVTAHAEMQAITAAAEALGGKYLVGCTLYVTVEPCAMCAAAIGWSQMSRVVYGTPDVKRGYTQMYARSPLHVKTVVKSGVLEEECRELMQSFFRMRRRK